MKSLELLEKYYATKDDKKAGTGSPSTRLPLLKKLDLLHELYTEIKALDKKTLGTMKKRVTTVLDALGNEGAGAMLTRVLKKTYEELFEQVDRSRLPQFFDREMQIITSSKVEPSHKITHLYLIGKIYQRFATGMMMSAPTGELIAAVTKFMKNSTEESALACIRRIMKSRSSTLNSHWSELLKIINRQQSDKSMEVRVQVAKCYKEAAKFMRSDTLTHYYDNIYSAALKGFEDDQTCVREQYVEALASAMSNSLRESVSERLFDVATKRRATDPPKNLLDVYNAFQSVFVKDKDSLKECSVMCIWKVLCNSPEYVRQTKPLLLLQLELTWLFKCSTYTTDTYKFRTYLSWLFIEYTKLLGLPLQIKLKELILSNLDKILDRRDKPQQANDQQIILILSALSALILQLGPHLVEHNSDLNYITGIITPFLVWNRAQVRLAASECVKALMYRCRPWVCQLLSLFLNMTTVSHAELAGLAPGPLFVGVNNTQFEKDSLLEYYTALSVHSGCLSSLLYCTDTILRGVPLDIANSALVSAKGMILGYRYHEDEEAKPIESKEKELLAKKHAGWIVIQGLLGLGASWVSGNLSTFIKLWNGAFSKESCLLEGRKEGLEQLAQNFVIKAEALRALHDFMLNYKELMNQQVVKFVGNALVNCALYLFSNSTKEPKKALFDMFPIKYAQMKLDLWDSLGIMPSHTYEEAYIALLHNLADTITTSNVIPTLYKYWESNDELMLISKDDQSVWKNGKINVFSENFMEESEVRVYNASYPQIYAQGVDHSLRMRLVNSAIKLYANIFCSSHLSHKNRVQLCKHLQAHLAQPGEGNNKQFTIVLLCYAIVRHLAKTPSTCELLPEPDQIFALLRSISELVCGMSNHALRTLGCELVALLHKAFHETLPGLLSSLIPELTKLSDSTEVLYKSKATLIAGYIFKYFDPDKLISFVKPLEGIITKQLKDPHALSKFYGFFTIYLVLKHTANAFPSIIDQNLTLCLHNYNTDIRLDKSIFALICRVFDCILQIRPAAAQGKLPMIALDTVCLSRCGHPLVSTSILQFLKHCFLYEKSLLSPSQIVEIALRNLFSPEGTLGNKKLALEIVGILTYEKQFNVVKQADPIIIWKLLDELNTVKSGKPGTPYLYDQKRNKRLLKLNTWEIDVEKSLNFYGSFGDDNTQTRLSEVLGKSEELLYAYTLKQVLILIFKELVAKEGAIQDVIAMIKHTVEYRAMDEDFADNSKSPTKESIVTRDKKSDVPYKFKKPIIIGTKCFMIKLLEKLILEEKRESELTVLVSQFSNVMTIGNQFVMIENNPHKDSAFKLVKTAIKQCKDIKDLVVPLNEEDETSDLHSGLEVFEAQIHGLIKQYMSKNSSYSTLESIFSIFYYCCTIPISRDPKALTKLMDQLVDPLRELAVTGSVEFSCEKHALKCHFKRLKTLCKLFFVGVGVKFDPYIRKGGNKKKMESKFLKPDDWKRIQSLFTKGVEEYLGKHIIAALNDCWYILTQNKKVAKQKTNYALIHSGVPSAYSLKTCESSVLYFLKYLSLRSSSSSFQALLGQNLHIVLPFVMHYLSKKPQVKSFAPDSSGPIGGDIKVKLGQILLQKRELLSILSSLIQTPHLEITEELLVSCLESLEKLTDTKVIEFSQTIVEIVSQAFENFIIKNESMGHFGKMRILTICEEIFGKIWPQSINAQSPEESDLFLALYTAWKKIIIHYAQSTDCGSQFQLTFNTIVAPLSGLIPDADISNAKIYAKLCITTLKELFASPFPFVKLAVSQYLQDVVQILQRGETLGEKVDILFIIAINCAILLGTAYSEDLAKPISAFLEIYDQVQVQAPILKTTIAVVKASTAELKTNALTPLLLEHLLQQVYRCIEHSQGDYSNMPQKLQLIVLLYQTIGGSEDLFGILFSLYLSLCSAAFPNVVLKEALASMNAILAMNPALFKAAVAKLDSREIKYLQLLMRLHASNQID